MSREQDAYDHDENTKPIAITFALVGLYLHVEQGFSGQQVQRAYGAGAREKNVAEVRAAWG